MAQKKKKKKYKKIKISGDFYAYKGGEYVREKLGSKRGCIDYRYKRIKEGRLLLICIKDKEGPRGGKTKAIALLRDKDIDLREYKGKERSRIKEAIKKFRKLKEKMKKKKRKKK